MNQRGGDLSSLDGKGNRGIRQPVALEMEIAIPTNDLWIAALALQLDLELCTTDGHCRPSIAERCAVAKARTGTSAQEDMFQGCDDPPIVLSSAVSFLRIVFALGRLFLR
jgi:hypothetical protein